jgi:hypothetical protein
MFQFLLLSGDFMTTSIIKSEANERDQQVPDHKDNAQECRELAKRMLRPEDRDALERIAQIWERLEKVGERPRRRRKS